MPETQYVPNPWQECVSPAPCPDPCDTQAYILKRQTQCIICDPVVAPDSDSILTDLVAYWTMDEPLAGDVRQDSHAGDHDLAAIGNPGVVAGKISNAVRCVGSSGSNLINSDVVFGFIGAYTMAGWVNFRDNISGTGAYLVGKQNRSHSDGGGFPSEGYMLYINSGGLFTIWHGNGVSAQEVTDTNGFDVNDWYFIVCGSTGTVQFIQVNGGVRFIALGVTPSVGSKPFQFGELKGSAHPTHLVSQDAYFDEFGVWSRALTEAEASYLYNSGAGRTYPFT